MGCNCITAARHAIGVDVRRVIRACNLSAGAAPCVIQRVLRIEVVAERSRGRGLAHHDRTGIDRTTG